MGQNPMGIWVHAVSSSPKLHTCLALQLGLQARLWFLSCLHTARMPRPLTARLGLSSLDLGQQLATFMAPAHMPCLQVADGSMQCVSAVPSLRAVVLGHTRVQDAGLAMLASLPCLTHLALAAEGITQEGLLVSQPIPDRNSCSFCSAGFVHAFVIAQSLGWDQDFGWGGGGGGGGVCRGWGHGYWSLLESGPTSPAPFSEKRRGLCAHISAIGCHVATAAVACSDSGHVYMHDLACVCGCAQRYELGLVSGEIY